MKQSSLETRGLPPTTQHVHIPSFRRKSVVEAYILAIALGFLGAHHFYLRRTWFGVAYLFTFGLFGVGYVVDLFRIPCLVKQANKKLENPHAPEERNLCDAYLLWFPCGLFGLHLHYLRKPGQAVLYFFTFGLFGIGFLVDFFRIPFLVKAANKVPQDPEPYKSMCAAYVLGASPLGLLGMHHYYLNRPMWGILYTFTCGLAGVGWIFDWFRMPVLVKRANAINSCQESPGKKYVDDAYILWFPLGFFGFHHYYLGRTGWGVLYTFTVGLFGIGWLVDCCRLPCLVSDSNKKRSEMCLIGKNGTTIMPAGSTTVTITTQGPNVMPPPAAGGAMAPGTYSYQNMASYPPYGYQGQQPTYQQGPYYSNAGFYPTLPTQNVGADPSQQPPPTYEESIATQAKTAPPDVDSTRPPGPGKS